MLRLFVLRPDPHTWGLLAAVLVSTVLSIAIPIKIWNSARIEHRLQEQEKLLMASRLDALASQINPHFLFNTLTSISSLIRSEPEKAQHRAAARDRTVVRDRRAGQARDDAVAEELAGEAAEDGQQVPADRHAGVDRERVRRRIHVDAARRVDEAQEVE